MSDGFSRGSGREIDWVGRAVIRRLLSDDGLAMVELALILPFLSLILFATLAFGKTLVFWSDETHLSREGARWAATNTCAPCQGQTVNTWVIGTADTPAIKTNAVLTVRFAVQAGVPVPLNHCYGAPVRVTVAWPNYQIFPSTGLGTISSMGASTVMRLEHSWHGDPVSGKGSVSDVYDVEPGSASADSCPT